MKIIIVTSIMLPMPPVKGGAVQNLIKLQLDENEISQRDEIHVFSYYDKQAEVAAQKYRFSKFHYILNNGGMEKIHHMNIKGISGAAFRYRESYYKKHIIEEICSDSILEDFDILILENCPQFAPEFREAFGEKKKIFVHLHNDYVNQKTKNIEQIIKATDKFICISQYIAEIVKKCCPDNKIVVAYNGVQMNPLSPVKQERLKKKYNIEKDDFVVIFSGRLVKEKGAHCLLQAYEYISNKDKCKILFLGSRLYGENTSDSYTNELYAIAEKYKDNIIFTGYIDYNEISDYYALADVGCLPALWDEPLSLTVIEYLMSGLPVITTKAGGIPELVSDECAFVYDRCEDLPRSIAKSINCLQLDSEKKNKMSVAALLQSTHFTKEKYLDSFYQALLL